MTDHQAKAVTMASVRRGRKRARDLIVRVVSGILDSYTVDSVIATRSGLEADIRQALMDPSHPARDYAGVDKYIDHLLGNGTLEPTLNGTKPFIINF